MPSIFINRITLFWEIISTHLQRGKAIKSPIRYFPKLNPAFTLGKENMYFVKNVSITDQL